MLRTLEAISSEVYSIFHYTVQMELLSTTTNRTFYSFSSIDNLGAWTTFDLHKWRYDLRDGEKMKSLSKLNRYGNPPSVVWNVIEKDFNSSRTNRLLLMLSNLMSWLGRGVCIQNWKIKSKLSQQYCSTVFIYDKFLSTPMPIHCMAD